MKIVRVFQSCIVSLFRFGVTISLALPVLCSISNTLMYFVFFNSNTILTLYVVFAFKIHVNFIMYLTTIVKIQNTL